MSIGSSSLSGDEDIDDADDEHAVEEEEEEEILTREEEDENEEEDDIPDGFSFFPRRGLGYRNPSSSSSGLTFTFFFSLRSASRSGHSS